MRIVARMLTWALILALAFAVPACAGTGGALTPQDLDYTENPVDIPNPDRGFYRANDGMVVPVTATPDHFCHFTIDNPPALEYNKSGKSLFPYFPTWRCS